VIEKADYHIHTKLCKHATGEIDQYVEMAIRLGMFKIGFSDHAPTDSGFDPAHRMNIDEFPYYIESIERAKKSYSDINIVIGIEADIYPGFEKNLEKLRRDFPVEYVIGSVHFIDDVEVHGNRIQSYSKEEKSSLIKRYFDLLETGIYSGLIDVVAHIDLIKWSLADMQDEIVCHCERILKIVDVRNLILEVNTSGLRKKPGEIYPGPDILNRASLLNIPVCLGSDAHNPDDVGLNFEDAVSILKRLGYVEMSRSKDGLGKVLNRVSEIRQKCYII